jgi:CRP-like cAMP-binding protein
LVISPRTADPGAAMHDTIENDGAQLGQADRASDPRAAEQNNLLRAIPADEYARLVPLLEPVELSNGQVLWRSETPIRSVYFPRTCVLSLLTPLEDEQPVEAATVGREGMAGVPVVLGVHTTYAQAIAQVPGEAVRLDAGRLTEWLRKADGALFPLLLRYAQALQEQTAQSVACNRRHEMGERCARWLLMTHDRVGADHFALTHEFLAFMLGVRRASVTVAAGMLQQAGLIRYSRGKVTILDRNGLEAASCECYGVIRRQYERLLGGQPAMG